MVDKFCQEMYFPGGYWTAWLGVKALYQNQSLLPDQPLNFLALVNKKILRGDFKDKAVAEKRLQARGSYQILITRDLGGAMISEEKGEFFLIEVSLFAVSLEVVCKFMCAHIIVNIFLPALNLSEAIIRSRHGNLPETATFVDIFFYRRDF